MLEIKILTGTIDANDNLLILKSTDIGFLSHTSPTLNDQARYVNQQVFIG